MIFFHNHALASRIKKQSIAVRILAITSWDKESAEQFAAKAQVAVKIAGDNWKKINSKD
jgi:predicted dehydrogenase